MANHVKPRSQEQTAISVSITKELLTRIDNRADELGLSRSRYIAVVAQIDIAKGGPLTIPTQGAAQPAPPVALTAEVTEFLKLAVPILTQYQDSHGECPPPEVPQHIAESELWPFFLKQRDQILKDKWNSSKDAGYDIGMERAIREWLQRNYLVWAPEDVEDPEPEPAAAQPTTPA
jgi:hypothetical protein